MKSPLFVRRVVGHSMKPTLNDGQVVLASGLVKPKVGDLVIARVEGLEVIKRVASIEAINVRLTGDALGHGFYALVRKSDISVVVSLTQSKH